MFSTQKLLLTVYKGILSMVRWDVVGILQAFTSSGTRVYYFCAWCDIDFVSMVASSALDGFRRVLSITINITHHTYIE